MPATKTTFSRGIPSSGRKPSIAARMASSPHPGHQRGSWSDAHSFFFAATAISAPPGGYGDDPGARKASRARTQGARIFDEYGRDRGRRTAPLCSRQGAPYSPGGALESPFDLAVDLCRPERRARHLRIALRVDEELGPDDPDELTHVRLGHEHLRIRAQDFAGVPRQRVQVEDVGEGDRAATVAHTAHAGAQGPVA